MARATMAVLAGIAAMLMLAFGWMDALELPLRDALLRALPKRPASHTVVAAIDERALREIGPWPWPRAKLADIVDAAADAKARVVVIDVLLAEPSATDARLRDAMRRVPAILVSVLDERGQWLLPAPLLRESGSAAHGNFEVDGDGILRRLAATKQSATRMLPALSVAAFTRFSGARIQVARSVAPAFRTPAASIPRVSVAALRPEQLRDRIVFIGPTALALGDRVLTPTSTNRVPDPGVTVHAAAAESLLAHDVLHPLPPYLGGLASAILAFGIVSFGRVGRRVFAAAMFVVTIAVSAVTLDTVLRVMPLATWLLTIAITLIVLEAMRIRGTDAATTRMESQLGIRAMEGEVETRLDAIASRVAEQRTLDAESKRVLAHELRTPLASMRSLTQLLAGFELSDAERQRVTSLLETETGKLQSLVDTLLDLERLSVRPFDAPVIDLGALVAQRLELFRGDRVIETRIDENVYARADAALFERVIDNLVANALKYTSGEVIVRVLRSAAGAVFEVEDRGPGISDEDRQRIFERFFRGRTASGTRGLGLGLALVTEIAKWHGGSVELEQPDEGGSLFRVRLA